MDGYCSIELDSSSSSRLRASYEVREALSKYDDWRLVHNLHVTISYGKSILDHTLTNWAWKNRGSEVKFDSMRFYADDRIISIMVGAPSDNKYAHITVATRLDAKPKDSNSIDWSRSIKFEDFMGLRGVIKYIKF